MSERVLIVGAGQVGRGLFRAFRASGVDVLGLHGRRASPYTTSSGPLPQTLEDANTVVVAVRDEQIDEAISQVLDSKRADGRRRITSGTSILHTSGIAEPTVIPHLAAIGLGGGTFHPLMPFANLERAPELLRAAWIGIDGDDTARAVARRLAGQVGARTLDIPPGRKGVYHAAAVMSSNFPVVLAAVATQLLADAGVNENSAQRAVHSLLEAAASNLADVAPAMALTGPVVRGDSETIARHLSALRGNQEARAVYRRLTVAALEIAGRRGTDPGRLAEIQNLLLLR